MRMRFALSAMAAVGTAFGAVLWFGFWFHWKRTSIPDSLLGLLMALAIVAISVGLLHFVFGIPLGNDPPRRMGVSIGSL